MSTSAIFSPKRATYSSTAGTSHARIFSRQEHTAVDWRAMAGLRDRPIHGYFGVDHDLVWDVITNKVPDLQREIERLLTEERR